MISKPIIYFGEPFVLSCDAKCHKAWGVNGRPHVQLSDDLDDLEWLSDDELGEAPVNPGTWEGQDTKPTAPEQRLNKWCARECERSVKVAPGEDYSLPGFIQRVKNITG